MSRSEMRQITQACRLGYEIPEKELRETPAMLLSIMNDPKMAPRNRVMASKTLLALRKFGLDQVLALNTIGVLNPSDEEVRSVRTPLRGPGEPPLPDVEPDDDA